MLRPRGRALSCRSRRPALRPGPRLLPRAPAAAGRVGSLRLGRGPPRSPPPPPLQPRQRSSGISGSGPPLPPRRVAVRPLMVRRPRPPLSPGAPQPRAAPRSRSLKPPAEAQGPRPFALPPSLASFLPSSLLTGRPPAPDQTRDPRPLAPLPLLPRFPVALGLRLCRARGSCPPAGSNALRRGCRHRPRSRPPPSFPEGNSSERRSGRTPARGARPNPPGVTRVGTEHHHSPQPPPDRTPPLSLRCGETDERWRALVGRPRVGTLGDPRPPDRPFIAQRLPSRVYCVGRSLGAHPWAPTKRRLT